MNNLRNSTKERIASGIIQSMFRMWIEVIHYKRHRMKMVVSIQARVRNKLFWMSPVGRSIKLCKDKEEVASKILKGTRIELAREHHQDTQDKQKCFMEEWYALRDEFIQIRKITFPDRKHRSGYDGKYKNMRQVSYKIHIFLYNKNLQSFFFKVFYVPPRPH